MAAARVRAECRASVKPSWASWDMIHNLRCADQAGLKVTDATRTAAGPGVALKGVSADQWAFPWGGMGSL